jgi:hypothetical protein
MCSIPVSKRNCSLSIAIFVAETNYANEQISMSYLSLKNYSCSRICKDQLVSLFVDPPTKPSHSPLQDFC